MKSAFMSEQMKYRLIGLVVVLSLLVLFLPAVLKQSNQRFDDSMNFSFRLPKKPGLPQVTVVERKNLFKTVKVATVTVPAATKAHTHTAQAIPLSAPKSLINSVQMAGVVVKKGDTTAPMILSAKSDDYFTIQLATFSRQANAQALVSRLRQQGFPALSQVINREDGAFYQVIVGQLKQRDQAIDLQRQLVNNTQLNGLIIKTKVS